jgi:uncharacterized protein YaiI (UPF0178 family)
MPDIYIDTEVHEIYVQALRAAQRYSLELYVITRDYVPVGENVHLIVVEGDKANGGAWIAANIARGDICVTADPGVAANCIQRGALALAPSGRLWGKDTANNDPRTAESWPADIRAFTQRLDRVIASARAMSPGAFAPPHGAHRSGFAEPRPFASLLRAVF